MNKQSAAMEIDPQMVDAAFRGCLYTEDELRTLPKNEKGVPKGTVLVEGVAHSFGLHPQRLEATREQVTEWLKLLPHQFRTKACGGGDGWSFLNACVQEDGNQWTGEHRGVEQLFCLGMGLGLAKLIAPRETWSIMPGGMPYYSISVK